MSRDPTGDSLQRMEKGGQERKYQDKKTPN